LLEIKNTSNSVISFGSIFGDSEFDLLPGEKKTVKNYKREDLKTLSRVKELFSFRCSTEDECSYLGRFFEVTYVKSEPAKSKKASPKPAESPKSNDSDKESK
jgi:hypothetical protein